MKMKRCGSVLIFLVVLSTVAFSVQNKKDSKKDEALIAVGSLAPNWQLVDPSGKQHELKEYRGKVIVLDFWATWCGPCKSVMAKMQKLHQKYDESQVVVFGVNSWEQGDPAVAMKRLNYTYTVLLKGEQIAGPYGVTTLPSVYVIGTDGRVIYRHQGLDDKNLSGLIDKYLKDVAPKSTE